MRILLKQMREKRRMNQKELERASGVPQAMISQIEIGDVKNPTIGTLYKIACGLRCTVDDLIEE